MPELKPCPFCGCSTAIRPKAFQDGTVYNLIDGWHDDGCPLQWHVFAMEDDNENPLLPEEVAERWNRRWHDA